MKSQHQQSGGGDGEPHVALALDDGNEPGVVVVLVDRPPLEDVRDPRDDAQHDLRKASSADFGKMLLVFGCIGKDLPKSC